MKIKNVIFSGFAAAIFAGVCGAVDAASVSLVSKSTYEEGMATKQNILTPGDNINIANDIISATGLVTESKLTEVQTALQAAIDGKQAAGEYAAADALEELAADVEALKGSSTSNEVIEQLNARVEAIAADYVTDSEMQAAIAGVQALIPSLEGYAKTADLAAVATSGQYADLEGKPEIPTLDGLATSEELNTLRTTLEASIAEKQQKGEYLVAADLKTLEDAVEALQTGKADASTVTTIQETISNLGDTYASDSELAAAIAAVELKIPTVPTNVSAFNNDAGYLVSADLSDYAKTADVSANLASAVSTLEDSIALKAAQSDMTAAQSAIAEAQAAITALQNGKADAQTVTNLQNAVNALGDTYATDAELKDQIDAVKVLINNIDLSDYATTTYVNEELAKKQNELQLGENLQWVDGKLDTKGIATADGLAELENKVNNAAQKTYVDDELAKKADSTTVASDIATALQTAKDYADANDADTIYDDTQVKADIAANTQAIANIEEYDDTALAARVSANETGIADNKSAIEALQGAGHQTEAQVKTIVEGYGYQTSEQVQNAITTSTADMVTDAELEGKGYVVGTKTAGSYLVNFDAEGNASYAAVEILDDKGNPIDLTSGAVK